MTMHCPPQGSGESRVCEPRVQGCRPPVRVSRSLRPSDNGALVDGLGREKMVDPSSLVGQQEQVGVMLHVHGETMPDSGLRRGKCRQVAGAHPVSAGGKQDQGPRGPQPSRQGGFGRLQGPLRPGIVTGSRHQAPAASAGRRAGRTTRIAGGLAPASIGKVRAAIQPAQEGAQRSECVAGLGQ